MKKRKRNGREKNGEREKLNIILDIIQMSKSHSLHEYIGPYITQLVTRVTNL